MMVLSAIMVVPFVTVLLSPNEWRDFDENGKFNDPFPEAWFVVSLFALGLVIFIGFLLEWRLRRRESRR